MGELQEAIEQFNAAVFKGLREQWWVFVLVVPLLGGLAYATQRLSEHNAVKGECKAWCLDRAAASQAKYDWYEYVNGKCYCMLGYQVVRR